ncbi:serine O-acetyltransferase EpsC [Methylobacter tundripaludum]|uniref:serine O-acetyltransferase n=1 Tax=Methylobacter tundripaludum (strain ATCC BAA-1195 / DSM 17260 / SV96) TaxID=697282 RepID=G3IXL4_METTV|nr:serine O-acetyltransferase EpsC [Methylobacter tundripaludum]EGW23423.1 Serine O-acetyltransferase [Methylobacter tundripaludum SV96]
MNGPGYQNIKQDWGIDELVTKLRHLRVQSLETRHRRDRPPKLPSRKELQKILDGLGAVLFPNRLGLPDLNDEGIDYFVGHTLDTLLRELYKQIRRELQFTSGHTAVDDAYPQAVAITREFAARLPEVRTLLDSDIQAAYEGDPAARSSDEVLVCYPGITAITHHRLAHILYQLGAPLVARIISELAHSATGIDIHPGAKIGESFFIDHGTGVVIGETAVIGRHVRVYQAVTLGAKRFQKDDDGILVKGNARHPIVEDDVVIYAGATILGRITIGRGSTIGGNVWLTYSVPPGSNITQAHVRSELFHDGGGI